MAVAICPEDMTTGTSQSSSLRARLADKCSEGDTLEAELRRARLDLQQLSLRLKAAGVSKSIVPLEVKAGSGTTNGLTQQYELESFLQWAVDTVDLTQQIVFECGNGEVMVGGRPVMLQRMATWPLRSGSGGLKFSVPFDKQAEIVAMLLASRTGSRCVDAAVASQLAESWELVGAEVVSNSTSPPDPAIFLVHRKTSQAIVVAQWPAVEFGPPLMGPPPCVFDPAPFFARSQASSSNSSCPTNSSLQAARLALSVSTGDRVEVEFEGEWFPGVLQWVDGEFANVKCDVDSPGVLTVAPLDCVRPAKSITDDVPAKILSRHMRARSVG